MGLGAIFLLLHHTFIIVVQSLSQVQPFVTLWTIAPPDSSVHGISQVRILEWVAISISRDIPDPGIEPESPALQADSLSLSHQGIPELGGRGGYCF